MDTDFNNKPKYLGFMADSIRFYDCVLGLRFVYGGKMFLATHHMLNWVFNLFVRFSMGGQVKDNLYGLFTIRRDVLM